MDGMQGDWAENQPSRRDWRTALVTLPPVLSAAKAIQLIKGGSSKWIHETFPSAQDFEWQKGYGAFSVSVSTVPAAIAYIGNQEAHHRNVTFEEEFLAFLRRHGITCEDRYVLG